MAAPKGNTNAEKWSLEASTKLLKDMTDAINRKEYYLIGSGVNINKVEGYEFDFIGELACEFGVYHHLITRDIPNRFPELKQDVKYIISTLERNCYSNTKKGIINTAVGIVNLKSNHKWTDRLDQTSQGNELNNKLSIEIVGNEGD